MKGLKVLQNRRRVAVAQWVKHWPTDLAVQVRFLPEGEPTQL